VYPRHTFRIPPSCPRVAAIASSAAARTPAGSAPGAPSTLTRTRRSRTTGCDTIARSRSSASAISPSTSSRPRLNLSTLNAYTVTCVTPSS